MAGRFQYGGQAVIEGVMMRGKTGMSVAVRRPNQEISIYSEPIVSAARSHRIWRLPFLRGMLALYESFTIGLKALMYSANQAVEGEGEEKLTVWETILMVGMALVMVVGLFIMLPLAVASLLRRGGWPPFAVNLAEAVIRALVLVGYIRIVTLLKDIRRVFSYHGAEHKVIHTYEAGEELTVENARGKSTLHPRCGTSFLFFVVLVSAVLFSIVRVDVWYLKVAWRIALLPFIAGISFEIIKLAGKKDAFFLIRWLGAPGMWLQKMTTREPDDSMLEVAIAALQGVLNDDGSHA